MAARCCDARLDCSRISTRASSACFLGVMFMQTPVIRTGCPSGPRSTWPLPSTHRTVPSGPTIRYSTSCATPSDSARWIDANTRSRSSDESRVRSFETCRRYAPPASRESVRRCPTSRTDCARSPNPTCPCSPRRAQARRPHCSSPSVARASAQPRRRLVPQSDPRLQFLNGPFVRLRGVTP